MKRYLLFIEPNVMSGEPVSELFVASYDKFEEAHREGKYQADAEYYTIFDTEKEDGWFYDGASIKYLEECRERCEPETYDAVLKSEGWKFD